MTTNAMKLALWHEAMAREPNRNQAKKEKHEATSKFIREALAKQEQGEPVAVMELHAGGWDLVEDIDTDWLETLPFGTKLYTTPQQPSTIVRTWVGLTAEEVSIIEHEVYNRTVQKGKHMSIFITQFAKAVETKLKDKNENSTRT